jgi:hypothetical protein
MQLTHVSAEEAGQGFLDLGARSFIPMHWGTFRFGTDHHEGPYERLLSWWGSQKLTETKELLVCKIGQRYHAPDFSVTQPVQTDIQEINLATPTREFQSQS